MQFYDTVFFVEGDRTKATAEVSKYTPWPITVKIKTDSFEDGRITLHFSAEAFFTFAESVADAHGAVVMKGFKKEEDSEELN